MRKMVVEMWCELTEYSDYRCVNEEDGGGNVVCVVSTIKSYIG